MTCLENCAQGAPVVITQELLDRATLSRDEAMQCTERLGEKRMIDGKEVALVLLTNLQNASSSPVLMCACDFQSFLVDTYLCPRKGEWLDMRRKEVAAWYGDQGLTPEIIFDIFTSVTDRGEFLGQQHGDIIYVQEIAGIIGALPPSVWGKWEYPLRADSAFYNKEMAHRRELVAQCSARSTEEQVPVKELTEQELAFHYARDLVCQLHAAKRIGLNGMMLFPYVAPQFEVPVVLPIPRKKRSSKKQKK